MQIIQLKSGTIHVLYAHAMHMITSTHPCYLTRLQCEHCCGLVLPAAGADRDKFVATVVTSEASLNNRAQTVAAQFRVAQSRCAASQV